MCHKKSLCHLEVVSVLTNQIMLLENTRGTIHRLIEIEVLLLLK